MAVMKVIDVAIVLDRGVAAGRSVFVGVIAMFVSHFGSSGSCLRLEVNALRLSAL